jgi:hypothetical protein
MDGRSAKTVRRVIVHQPDRLHPGVDNDGADQIASDNISISVLRPGSY